METILDKKNELLKRREVKLVVEAESNPGFQEGVKIISKKFGASDDLIVMRGVKGKFGRHTFLIDAFIYDSLKDREIFHGKTSNSRLKDQASGMEKIEDRIDKKETQAEVKEAGK